MTIVGFTSFVLLAFGKDAAGVVLALLFASGIVGVGICALVAQRPIH